MALTRASKKSDVRSPSKQPLTIFLSYRRVIGLAVGDARRLAPSQTSGSIAGGRDARASGSERRANKNSRAAAKGEQSKTLTSANMCEHSPRSGAYVTRQLPVISTG